MRVMNIGCQYFLSWNDQMHKTSLQTEFYIYQDMSILWKASSSSHPVIPGIDGGGGGMKEGIA